MADEQTKPFDKSFDVRVITRPIWNAFLQYLEQRMAAVEAQRKDLDDAFAEIRNVSITRIDAVIAPLIADQQLLLASLQADTQDVIDRVNLILASGIGADDVVEAPTRVFVTPTQRASLGGLPAALAKAKTDAVRASNRTTARMLIYSGF